MGIENMRMMMTASMDVEAANEAIKNGMLPQIVKEFHEKHKPEAMYFGVENGQRTAYMVFDLKEASDIPSIAEPWFIHLKAKIAAQPVMDMADMQAGISKAMASMAVPT
jgi:Domain of unknown function (DUF3303)